VLRISGRNEDGLLSKPRKHGHLDSPALVRVKLELPLTEMRKIALVPTPMH
jgi:hypothetical protein